MITHIYFDWGNTLAYPSLKKEFVDTSNKYLVLYPDAEEILRYLSKKYEIGIISNSKISKNDFTNALVKSNLIKYFNSISLSNEICKKPCQNIFLKALNNINPQNAVMIGDNYNRDVIGAETVGMNVLCRGRDFTNLWELYYLL